jgi:hypothetical protein
LIPWLNPFSELDDVLKIILRLLEDDGKGFVMH